MYKFLVKRKSAIQRIYQFVYSDLIVTRTYHGKHQQINSLFLRSVEDKSQKYSCEHLDSMQMEHVDLLLRNVASNIR